MGEKVAEEVTESKNKEIISKRRRRAINCLSKALYFLSLSGDFKSMEDCAIEAGNLADGKSDADIRQMAYEMKNSKQSEGCGDEN